MILKMGANPLICGKKTQNFAVCTFCILNIARGLKHGYTIIVIHYHNP
jgi:hypothetical protein